MNFSSIHVRPSSGDSEVLLAHVCALGSTSQLAIGFASEEPFEPRELECLLSRKYLRQAKRRTAAHDGHGRTERIGWMSHK